MKPSQIAMLSAGGVVAGTIVVAALIVRIALSQTEPAGPGPRERAPGNSDLTGFSAIEINGSWQVNVTQGDVWQVRFSYPEGDREGLEASVSGERLRLNGESPRRWFGGSNTPFGADIVMPTLDELELAGNAEIEFSGFEGARLVIEIAGAAEVEGRNGSYDELDLSVAGASAIDLQGIVVTDARVDLAGASDVTLAMDGGELTGSMAGAGNIEYYGSVSRESIDVAGFGNVDRAGE